VAKGRYPVAILRGQIFLCFTIGMKTNNECNLKELQSFILEFLDECTYAKRLSPITVRGYREVYGTFTRIMPEVNNLDSLTPAVVSQFYKRIDLRRKHKNLSPIKDSTLRSYYNKLLVFFKWLEQNGFKDRGTLADRVVKPKYPTYTDEKALDENQIAKIQSAIAMHTTGIPFLNKRDMMIVCILLYTGIRKGELLGLRIHDIDFSNRTLFIYGATSKSKKSRRIPINPILISLFKTYLSDEYRKDSSCPYLLISSQKDVALTEHGLKHWVKRYNKLSGVKFHLHQFRHTLACVLARNNADIVSIKSILGHSSIRMTERYLRSISSESARGFIDNIVF